MRRRPIAGLVFFLALSAGTAVALVSLSPLAALLVGLALASNFPLVFRAAQGNLDLLEPLVPASAAFIIMFVARPAFDVSRGTLGFLDFDISNGYPMALAAALVAVIAFNVGYSVAHLPTTVAVGAQRLLGFGQPRNDSTLVITGVALSIIGLSAALASAVLAGGAVTLVQDRGAIATGATNIPIVAAAATLTIPGTLLLWSVTGQSRRYARILSVFPLIVLGLTAIPKGDRRLLLPMLTAAISLGYLRRDRRPTWFVVGAALLVAFFVVVTPFRESRSGGQSFGEALLQGIQDPGRAVEGLMLAQDTSQVGVLAVLVQEIGDDRPLPWQYGMATLTETVLQPVPRQFWANKPETIRTQFIQYNWGMEGGRCVSQCPTVSVVGSLYADFGLPSVAIGCLAIGWFSKVWYLLMMSMRKDPMITAAYSATLFTFFLVWWSNLGVVVVDFAFYALPILVAGVFARAATQSHGRRDSAIGANIDTSNLHDTRW